MTAVLFAMALAVSTPAAAAQDSIPQVTLAEALQRAAQLDPDYVAALGQIGDAEWAHRAARLAFFTPTLTATTGATKYSSEFFNIGTGQLSSKIVDAQVAANYDLFAGGTKYYESKRTKAELEKAHAGETQARFQTALLTETEYYDVIAQRELAAVGRERVRRAAEQLQIARARVLAGGAVRTDTLQQVLELNRARVEVLREETLLRVARVRLGRRIGFSGEVDATTTDSLPAPPLPLSEAAAADEAAATSPKVLSARAAERAAEAAAKSVRGGYLPTVNLFGQWSAYDDTFFPNATERTSYGIRLTVPIWDRGRRELTNQVARSKFQVAKAAKRDTELEVRQEAVRAFEGYNTARASVEIEIEAVDVARENLRVQSERYRTGATTIIDLITAQVELSEAEVALVQARQVTRLALAGLEALLGRRLF
ncbi:MAG: TolC family protein [Rhodothermales bacterium]